MKRPNLPDRDSDGLAAVTGGLGHLDEHEGYPELGEQGPIDWYSPALLILVAIVVLVPSVQLGLGSFARPGPGLWPFLNALLVLALTPVVLISRHRFNPPHSREVLRVLGIVVPLLLFVPLYEWAGLIGAGAPMLLFIARFVGRVRWVSAVAVAVLTPVTVYFLFAVLLGVNLRPF